MWGVAAAAHAVNQAASVTTGAAEFRRPEMVAEMTGPAALAGPAAAAKPVAPLIPADSAIPADPAIPAALLDALPLLPRRRRAVVRRDHAEPAKLVDARVVGTSPGDAGGPDAGPGPAVPPGRPDLNLLAQVLEGLRRMA